MNATTYKFVTVALAVLATSGATYYYKNFFSKGKTIKAKIDVAPINLRKEA